MNKNQHRLFVFCVVATLTVATLLTIPFALGSLDRRKAERLSLDVQGLKLGILQADVQRVAKEYGGIHRVDGTLRQPGPFACTSAHCEYFLEVQHWLPIADADPCSKLHRWFLRPLNLLGFRPWDVAVFLSVDDGRLSGVLQQVTVKRYDGFVFLAETVLHRTGRGYDKDTEPYIVHYTHVTTTGNGEGLIASITPDETLEQLHRAYDVNFHCLTVRGGCQALGDLMPTAWDDFARSQGPDAMPTSGGPWVCN